MNILKKVFCVFYLGNLGNDRPHKRSGPSLFASIAGLGGVVLFNVLSVLIILERYDIIPHINNITLFIGIIVIIYFTLVIYFFFFKNYKIVDKVQHYSPWKKPLIGGVVYIFLSIIFLMVVAIFCPPC